MRALISVVSGLAAGAHLLCNHLLGTVRTWTAHRMLALILCTFQHEAPPPCSKLVQGHGNKQVKALCALHELLEHLPMGPDQRPDHPGHRPCASIPCAHPPCSSMCLMLHLVIHKLLCA